jgi:hypothetical protein
MSSDALDCAEIAIEANYSTFHLWILPIPVIRFPLSALSRFVIVLLENDKIVFINLDRGAVKVQTFRIRDLPDIYRFFACSLSVFD